MNEVSLFETCWCIFLRIQNLLHFALSLWFLICYSVTCHIHLVQLTHNVHWHPYLRYDIVTGPVFCCFQVNTWTGSCVGMPSFPCLSCVRCPAPKTVCSVPGLPGLCVPTPAQGRTQRASRPEHAPFWPTTQGTVGFLPLSNPLYPVFTKMVQILV